MPVGGFLNQTVEIEHRDSINLEGRATYHPAAKYRARVIPFHRMVLTTGGQQAQSHGKVFLGPETTIGITDRITLPDGTQPAILEVQPIPDGFGFTLYKAVLV